MNGWVLLGTVALSAIMVVYQYYNNSQRELEGSHQNRYRGDGADGGDEGDNQRSSNTTSNRLPQRKQPRPPNPPGADDPCVICQELLYDRRATQSYTLIALHPCQHWFHKTCAIMLSNYNNFCPVCRVPFDKTKL